MGEDDVVTDHDTRPERAVGALAIEINGARKTFPGGREAVRGVDLLVPLGGVHGLLGPNGAGKTTTLKMLLGLVHPTEGELLILGRDARRPETRAAVGFLPEQPYFPPQLTAAEVLRLGGKLSCLSRTEIDERTTSLLSRVGLEGRGRDRLASFSRGMLQRLGLAQALIGSPEVLVLDEPASGLDPVGQRDIRNLILELRDEGVTVLLSSHQLSEVEVVCDRVSVMHRGLVAAEGPLDDLLDVAGRTSLRVRDIESLPESVADVVEDVAASGGLWVFSVPDNTVRSVIDAIDDVGGTIVAVAPKRDSLEDYFVRLLERPEGEGL